MSNSPLTPSAAAPLPPSKRREILHSLVTAACKQINSQIDPYATRLVDALFAVAKTTVDSRDADLAFEAAKLLKGNLYPFYHLASAGLRHALQDAIDLLDPIASHASDIDGSELSLVPFAEMDNRMQLELAARPLDVANAEALSAINRRMAAMLGRDEVATADNPFRPQILISAFDAAWREFHPEAQSHHLLLQQMQAGVCIDPAPILQAVNQSFIAAGILPRLSDALQIKKSASKVRNKKNALPSSPELMQQLRRMFGGDDARQADAAGTPRSALHALAGHQGHGIAPALSAYLADLQQRSRMASQPGEGSRSAYRLNELRAQLPHGAMTRVDETTIDVMTRIFDAVFRDPNIAQEMKDLIGFLQVPVLKAALLDKEFFFEEAHPARRLISLLTSSSIGWDQDKGQNDPLYQAISRNVDRVQAFDSEIALFADVVSDLEAFLTAEESKAAAALAAPITKALKQEKLREATKWAASDVAVRVATGEVVTFVESFLESRWIPVLTLAHSVKEEKPQVLESAIKTMDELIWSVQPKITPQDRKELVSKLPGLLTALNKWLNVLKWNDAERLQFFADLAECHASIVRAPLELSPHRQLELAVEAAQKAAERRLEKQKQAEAATAEAPVPEPDDAAKVVETLERAMWFEFTQDDGSAKRVKLAWVSPLRSLYIFTTVHREEAFSLGADALADVFRKEKVRIVDVDGIVNQALVEAIDDATDDTTEATAATEEPAHA